MSEQNAAPSATGTPAPTQQAPAKYAGKYADEPALETGARNAWKKVFGKDAPEKLVGEGGMFANHKALEAFYTGLEHKIGAPKEDAPAANTLLDDPAKPKVETPLDPPDDDSPALGRWDETFQKANIPIADLIKAMDENDGKVPDKIVDQVRKQRPGWGKGDVQMVGAALHQLYATQSQLAQYQTKELRAKAASMVGGESVLNEMLENRTKFVPKEELAALDALLSKHDTSLAGAKLLKAYFDEAKASGKTQAVGVTPSGANYQPIKDKKELAELHAAARRGDKSAQERIKQAGQWASQLAR